MEVPLVANSRKGELEAITRTNADPDLCRHVALLDHNDLNIILQMVYIRLLYDSLRSGEGYANQYAITGSANSFSSREQNGYYLNQCWPIVRWFLKNILEHKDVKAAN